MPVTVDRPGILVLETSWEGRGLVNLKLFDEAGQIVTRHTGPSPVELRVTIQEAPRAPQEWSLRFAPTLTRGHLEGRVRVRLLPPDNSGLSTAELAELSQRAKPRPSAMRFEGPGRCLEAGAGGDAAGRALARLSLALGDASGEARAWTARWAQRLAELQEDEDAAGALDRSRIDRLWGRFKLDPPVDEECASAVRGLLAATERLSRHESSSDSVASLRAMKRRREVLGAVSCLAEKP